MEEEGEKVVLNVYDLSQGLARHLSTTLLGKVLEGIWHTGVVVYGSEYYFGGGIQSCPAGKAPYGKPQRVIELGYTEVPKEMFEEFLQEISPRYTAETYNLLRHNCNNFSDEVSQFLVGVSIPSFILELPQEVINSPMGVLIMPMIQQFETILRYGGVPQVPHLASHEAMPNFSQIQVPSTVSPPSHQSSVSRALASGKIPNVDGTSPSASSHQISIVGSMVTDKTSNVDTSTAAPAAPPAIKISSEVKTLEPPLENQKQALSPDKSIKVNDPLGEARTRVQEEITREFASLMAEGTLRASEAAALAARRVMERHSRRSGVTSQS